MNEYIEHSAKGTHWTKKNHKYTRKVGNQYFYDKQDTKQRNFLKGRKLVKRDPFTNQISKSTNRQMESSQRKFNIDSRNMHNQYTKNANSMIDEAIKEANNSTYNTLQSVDKQHRTMINLMRKGISDPKVIRKGFNICRNMLNKEIDSNVKNSKGLQKMTLSKAKKMLNSKKMDKLMDFVSRRSAKNSKKYANRFEKISSKIIKSYKKSVADQHKQYITDLKKMKYQT